MALNHCNTAFAWMNNCAWPSQWGSYLNWSLHQEQSYFPSQTWKTTDQRRRGATDSSREANCIQCIKTEFREGGQTCTGCTWSAILSNLLKTIKSAHDGELPFSVFSLWPLAKGWSAPVFTSTTRAASPLGFCLSAPNITKAFPTLSWLSVSS